ncbi:MAG: hypothetical protein AAB473_03030 [Patescibacteria group bacterium]
MCKKVKDEEEEVDINALLDSFMEDPEITIAMLNEEQAVLLLEAILSDVPEDTDWMHLLRMANGLGRAESVERFRSIIHAANNELRRSELLRAFVDYTINDEGVQLLRFEDAIAAGVFDELIVHLDRKTIKSLTRGTLAQPVVTAYSAGRIQRFIEGRDPKRAFDELVYSATAIDGWRPPLFEKWVQRVWQAHRDKGLVLELTTDPMDWRNNVERKITRFGRVRTKSRIKHPEIRSEEEFVPLYELWDHYRRPATAEERKLDWGIEKTLYTLQQPRMCTAPPMVDPPGNMIRDMAWHWHNESKERKLREFCSQHGIPYTDPV